MKNCKKCGAQMGDQAKFCPVCGAPWTDHEEKAEAKAPKKVPKKRGGSLLLVVCLLIACFVIGAGGFLVWSHLRSGGTESAVSNSEDQEERKEPEEDSEKEDEEDSEEEAGQENEKEEKGQETSEIESETEPAVEETQAQEAQTESAIQEEAAPAVIGLEVVNCNESITLRPGPSTTSGEICQIPLGAEVEFVSGASAGFLRIRYQGQEGYSMGEYLMASGPDYPKLQVVNCNESITLRPGPSTDSGEICQIPLGALVEFVSGAENGFYAIAYNGQEGYSLSSYLGQPSGGGDGKAEFMAFSNQRTEIYTYDRMTEDLQALLQQYPDLVTLDSLIDTPDGRKLWHMTIGREGADRHIFVNAAIHGREYVTSWLVMEQAKAFLQECRQSPELLPEDLAVHLVPMINPDGVSISQLGMDGCLRPQTKALVEEILERECEGSQEEFLKRWKSNAQGIDLNRNFDAMWEEYEDGVGAPSADHYKGEAPGCAPEAAALIKLTETWNFERTLSYHAQGSVIYWNFGQTGELKDKTVALAQEISEATGYGLDGDFSLLDPAGYKDWAITKKGIPSLTVEVGRETAPVPQSQYETIWQENKDVWRSFVSFEG